MNNPKVNKFSSAIKNLRFDLQLILENISFYGILIVIFWTAIPYGTVEPWSKLLFVFLTSLFALFRVIEGLLIKSKLPFNNLLFLPPIALLFLAVIQIIPFKDSTWLISALPSLASIESKNVPETKNFILILAALIFVGDILFRYTNTEKRLKTLIVLVLIIGLGSASFGFARLTFLQGNYNILANYINDKIQFAQFVNRNHFGFLMEMSLGILLGLQLKGNLDNRLKPLFWIMTAICGLAIILSDSRGSILSMVGLSLFSVLFFFLTKNGKSQFSQGNKPKSRNIIFKILATIIITLTFLTVSVFIIAFVGGDPAASRIGTISNELNDISDHKIRRREIWTSTIELIKDNPLTGCGFGAYSIAITKYDQFSGQLSLQQAHNDYLEILANGGFIAFILMIIFLIILGQKIKTQMTKGDSFRQAVSFGAASGIIGVLLHNLVDFGLHVICNILVFLILIVLASIDIPGSDNLKSNKKGYVSGKFNRLKELKD